MNNKEKILSYIASGLSNKEIATQLKVSLRTVERYRKQFKEATSDTKNDKKTTKAKNNKKVKEVAKNLVISGVSISEVAKQTQVPAGTIAYWSSEYNLQAKQLEFLKEFRDKQRERILKNKTKRLEINEEALKAIYYEVMNWKENGKISKALMEKLIMNEELEQLILGLDRIERLEKLEIERAKNKTEKIEDKKPIFIAGGGELED